MDNNKAIGNMTYNYLNLPQLVHIKGEGNVTYTYDALGNKLAKVIADSVAGVATTITYASGFVYQERAPLSSPGSGTDTLQYIGHEEGRIRWAYHIYTTGSTAYKFEYDFFERDHLGNTRPVLTQERDTTNYIATMEAAYRSTELQLFGNIVQTDTSWISMPNYTSISNTLRYQYTNPNDSVSRVDSSSAGGQKVGPNLLLKVMSGDTVNFTVQSYYVTPGGGSTNYSSFNDVLTSLSNGLVNLTAGAHGTFSNFTQNGSSVYNGLTSFLGRDSVHSGYPKAYVNWIFLDDQFNYDSALSGAIPAANGNNPAGTLNPVAPGGPIVLNRSGYLYIWVSNETSGWDVYFDNLSVQYKQGPLLEGSHFYPFGLTMAGLSDKAIKTNYAENKYRYNDGTELQNKEFSDGTGLEMYETTFRGYDPQLGRFGQIDPLADRFHLFSDYQFALNNPIGFNDPTGALTEAELYAALDEGLQLLNNPNFQDGGPQNVTLISGGQLPTSAGGGGSGGNGNDPAFMPSNLNGYEPIWQIDPINGPVIVGWEKILPIAMVTAQSPSNGNNGTSALGLAATTNDIIDQSMTATDATLRGTQKLANVVTKTNNEIITLSKVPVLNAVAKVTGVLTIYSDAVEARQEWNEGNKATAVWKGTEAVATGLIMLFGGEEIELAWNLGSMAVDDISKLVKKGP